MAGRIESGQLVTVEPVKDFSKLREGDIVLCKVHGVQYLHLIKASRLINNFRGSRYQIANNRGRINGWCGENSIYGIVVKVEE